MYVMSPAQAMFGAAGVKSRSMIFGAIGFPFRRGAHFAQVEPIVRSYYSSCVSAWRVRVDDRWEMANMRARLHLDGHRNGGDRTSSGPRYSGHWKAEGRFRGWSSRRDGVSTYDPMRLHPWSRTQ